MCGQIKCIISIMMIIGSLASGVFSDKVLVTLIFTQGCSVYFFQMWECQWETSVCIFNFWSQLAIIFQVRLCFLFLTHVWLLYFFLVSISWFILYLYFRQFLTIPIVCTCWLEMECPLWKHERTNPEIFNNQVELIFLKYLSTFHLEWSIWLNWSLKKGHSARKQYRILTLLLEREVHELPPRDTLFEE